MGYGYGMFERDVGGFWEYEYGDGMCVLWGLIEVD